MLGHLVWGLTTLFEDGVSTDPVFLDCDQLNALPPEQLAKLAERTYPSLRSCGRHSFDEHGT